MTELERIVLPARGRGRRSASPVRIFLGTEPAQWRAERVFVWSVERVRDPERTYEIHRMSRLPGFRRRGWTTGFTNFRYAIPDLAGRAGRALYNDVDQIYLSDPGELFDAELGSHGFLALSDTDTSVMLLDCARMSEVWTLEAARRLPKKALLARAAARPGLRGPLDPAWNARDGEYAEGHSKLLHYTTLHTQPWRPFPERYAYREAPEARVWHALEAEADAARFEPLAPRPEDLAALAGAAPPPARERERARARAAEAGLRDLAVLDGAALARWLAGPDGDAPPPREAVAAVGGLETLDPERWGPVVRRLARGTRRLLRLSLVAPPGRRGAERIAERVERALAGEAPLRWELRVRRGRGLPALERAGGPRLGPGSPRIWVLADDRGGNTTQALGVAEALGEPFEVRRVRFNRLAGLPPWLIGPRALGVERSASDPLAPPWPDLVIAAGARLAPVARWVGLRSGGRARLVHLGRKGAANAGLFDLAVTPRHARLWPHPRRLETRLPPCRVDDARLGAAAERWKEVLEAAPAPRVGLLVGGATRRHRFDAETARRLVEAVLALARERDGSLFVTTSRRTGAEATEALAHALGDRGRLWPWGPGRETPYLGLLALCDLLVVTGESESMLAEACATEQPVAIWPLPGRGRPGLGTRLAEAVAARAGVRRPGHRGTELPQRGVTRLCARLVDRGRVRPPRDLGALHEELVRTGRAHWLGDPPPAGRSVPLREAARVASHVRGLLEGAPPGRRGPEAG